MSTESKTKIHQLPESIENELTTDQLKGLDMAITEADNKDTITWDDFKKEMGEWKKHSWYFFVCINIQRKNLINGIL